MAPSSPVIPSMNWPLVTPCALSTGACGCLTVSSAGPLATVPAGLLIFTTYSPASAICTLVNESMKFVAPDSALPLTGVPQALERVLSAAFIATPYYGTRACSVVSIGQTLVDFTEHSFDAQGPLLQVQHTFARRAMPESP